MEETNRDQDSDTSSSSSWILLSNEEAGDEQAHIFFKQAVHNLTESDPKNNNSDIESDGISIISESEFSHDGRSDDETAIISDGEKCENNLDNTLQLAEDEEEGTENIPKEEIEIGSVGYKVELNRSPEETSNNSEEPDESIFENAIEKSVEKDLECMLATLEDIHNTEDSLSPDLAQTIDYKKLLRCPSLICTSVVIFAVILFPYFSSKINSPNTLDQQNVEQYDVPILPDKEIVGVDPLAYCKEIYKNNNLYNDHNIKKCMKKLLKQMRKSGKKGLAKEFHSVDLKKEEYEDKSKNKKSAIKYSRVKKIENNRDNKRQKYLKKYKYNINGHDDSEKPINENIAIEENPVNFDKKLSIEEIKEITEKLEMKELNLLEKEEYLKKLEKELKEKEQRLNQRAENPETDDIRYRRKKSIEKRKSLNSVDSEDLTKQEKSNENKKNFHKEETTVKNDRAKKVKEIKSGKKQDMMKDKMKNNQFARQNTGKFFKMHRIPKNDTKIYEDDNVTVTGDWYMNLVQSRQDIRRKEEKAWWWFDRAEFRKNKRNKAYWYFQYMFNRENLRYRPKNF